eukprot:6084630-Pyramimonas_sp.AAC.1
MLGAQESPDLGNIYTTDQSEAAFPNVSKTFSIEIKRTGDASGIVPLLAPKQRVSTEARLLPICSGNFLNDDSVISTNLKIKEQIATTSSIILLPQRFFLLPGLHCPDIAASNRTAPTPSTTDVPLAVQCLSSIMAEAWAGDVQS